MNNVHLIESLKEKHTMLVMYNDSTANINDNIAVTCCIIHVPSTSHMCLRQHHFEIKKWIRKLRSFIYSNNLDVLFHTPANDCKLKLNIKIKYRAFEA